MNAPLNHSAAFPANLDIDCWLIYGPGLDAMVCASEEEARHEYASLWFQRETPSQKLASGIRVVRFNTDDGNSRDLTSDFAWPGEDDADETEEVSLRQLVARNWSTNGRV